MAAHTLDLFAPVVAVTHAAMRRTVDLVGRYPSLPARDLVHVGTCLEHGIPEIISPDAHFDEVREIARIAPGAHPRRRRR
jgi:predicted nucleic acid-binding protein